MKHARINLNTGEAYEPPSARELIEKQISEASVALEAANGQIGYMQEREVSTLTEKSLAFLSATCERLLQIVQSQQAQIESLQEALSGTDEVVKGLVADPDAVRRLFEEVRKNV